MTATYTWDIFSSLDGYGSHNGDWGGYWGKEGPELLEHRLRLYDAPTRMVFGATTYREFVELVGTDDEGAEDDWGTRMLGLAAAPDTEIAWPRKRPSAYRSRPWLVAAYPTWRRSAPQRNGVSTNDALWRV